ncbi:MAG: FecR domain-containing protein, partial [Spirochaetota bacterium]
MKKACFVILCALIALPSFAATSATLREIKGKVEVKPLGKAWVEAREGMTIDLLATISTGFNSSATLVIADNKIAVAPLTRLTVDKIVEQAGTLGTSLHLRVGKVNAEVKSSSSTPQDFKVTSPYSTASVRGTIFAYDGFVLDVKDGTVTFIPGRPNRDIVAPRTRAKKTDSGEGTDDGEGSGEGEGTDDGEGTGEGEGTGDGEGSDTEGSDDETVSPEDYGLADFMADLAAEFPDDTFEVSDEGGTVPGQAGTDAGQGPSGPGAPTGSRPPATGIPVAGGGSLVLQLDLSTPAPGAGPQQGGSISTGQSGTLGLGSGTPGTGGLPLDPALP